MPELEFSTKGQQNMQPHNMFLWRKNYFELIIFDKQQTEEVLKTDQKLLFFKGNFHLQRKSLFVRVFSLYHKEKDDPKSQENLIYREGSDLNLCTWPPPNVFLLSVAEDGVQGGGLGLRGSYSVSLGISHRYRRYTCYKLLFLFLLFICLFTGILSQELRKRERKLFFFPYTTYLAEKEFRIKINLIYRK